MQAGHGLLQRGTAALQFIVRASADGRFLGCALQVRCKTGAVQNNGRALRVSDLPSYRPYEITDNAGRDWPGAAHHALLVVRCGVIGNALLLVQHRLPHAAAVAVLLLLM
jgi:hypothetical protein